MIDLSSFITPTAAVLSMSYAALTVTEATMQQIAPAIEGRGAVYGEVRPGETVDVSWEITKRTECEGINKRVWRGEDGFSLVEAEKPTTLPASDRAIMYPIPTSVPTYAPFGSLRLTIEGYYKCPGQAPDYFTLGPVDMEVVPWREGR